MNLSSPMTVFDSYRRIILFRMNQDSFKMASASSTQYFPRVTISEN